jgi:hypothetical protein
MNMRAEAAAVRRLEAEYCPSTERFELEDWLAQQLFDTYHNVHEGVPELFKFREAAILYVPSTELINATRLIGSDITEHCLLLSVFLFKNYGVKKLTNKADIEMQLMLSEYDFELMSVQIANDLVAWYENMSLVKDVLSKTQEQQKP